MSKQSQRGIRLIREAEGVDITQVKCLYCMDSRKCRHCEGQGTLSGKYGSMKLCGFCNGAKVCPHCSSSK